jgi:hypothetical protein
MSTVLIIIGAILFFLPLEVLLGYLFVLSTTFAILFIVSFGWRQSLIGHD